MGMWTTRRTDARETKMANLNDNDYGIHFDYKGRQQARYCDTHEYYAITLPEGVTPDDALAVAVSHGYKTKAKAAWHESYASVSQTTRIDPETHARETGYRLVITHPYLD